MEHVGVFLKEDWDSLNKMFTMSNTIVDIQAETDFAMQFLQCPSGEANANDDNTSNFDQESFFYSSQNYNPNIFYLSQESPNSTTTTSTLSNYTLSFPTQSHLSDHSINLHPMMNDDVSDQSMSFYVTDDTIITQFFPDNHVMQDVVSPKDEGGHIDTMANGDNTDLSLKRKFQMPQEPQTVEDQHPKKRSRVPKDVSTMPKCFHIKIVACMHQILTTFHVREVQLARVCCCKNYSNR